jgi:hypothetical protein
MSETAPPTAVMVFILIAIVVIAGAVVTIVNPKELPFHSYIQDVVIMASALGGALGIGLGLAGRSKDDDKGGE